MSLPRTLVALVVAASILGATSALSADVDHPHCPTEDSCTADYRDGGWVITEVTP